MVTHCHGDNQSAPFRWWFLLSWLGLDAPCVVLTWTWATSRAAGVTLPARPAAALFLVVWFIYLGDRLIDVASCRDWSQATGRLRFGRDFRLLFWVCLGLCLAGISSILWAGVPADVIRRAAWVAVGVGLHFLLFVVPLIVRVKLPGKEFGVGLFFALGAYACLGATMQRMPLLIWIALVVAYNCLVIAARDSMSDQANDPGGASAWWQTIDRDLLWLGAAFTLAAALSAALADERSFYLSLAVAFAMLTALHRCARRLSGDAVRALADFALFAPLAVMSVMAQKAIVLSTKY